jgi:Ethanolamine utilization protein EutJ (predicted chaperonin)
MVAKPLATCAMAWMDTCVVVDSGAFSTFVAVVLNGQVVPERWKHIPVGGWHVAEYLKQAMQWQPEEYTQVGHKQTVAFFYIIFCGGVRVGPLGISDTIWPAVSVANDE